MNIDIKLTSRPHNDGTQVIANLSYERGGRVWKTTVSATGQNENDAAANLANGRRLRSLLRQALVKELTEKKMIGPVAESNAEPAELSTPTNPVVSRPDNQTPKPPDDSTPLTSEPAMPTPKENDSKTDSETPVGIPQESGSETPAEEEAF